MSDPAPQPGSTPQGTGTPGKRTPAERARLAALARWGKYKGKGKPKGKGRKPAATPEAKEAARRQEAQANRAKVAADIGMDPAALDALGTFAAGGELDPAHAKVLFEAGLVQTNDDGSFRTSPTGRQVYNAASRGEAGQARDALAQGKDTAARQRDKDAKQAAEDEAPKEEEKKPEDAEKPKAGGGGGGSSKPSDEDKEAERKEKSDAKREKTRADIKEKMASADLGLSPSGFDAFTSFADGGDMPERMAADFQNMGLTEGSPSRLTEAGRSLRNAIDRGDMRGAVDAIERGKSKKKEGDERTAARAEKEKAALERAKAREDERTKRDAERKTPRRPMRDGIRIETKDADMDLADSLNTLLDITESLEDTDATKAGKRHNASDSALIQAIYDAACGVCEMAVSLGAVEEMDETVEDAMDYSVKMLPDGRVGGYAVRFGSSDEPDLSQYADFFTKSTDYWLSHWQTRPMLYHHAQDEATKDAPVVGVWTKATVDDVGVWLEGQLDTAHRYAGAVKELIRRGVLKLSSDSAPHLVIREPQPNGTNWVKRWPMLAASLTPTPAEPRLLAVSSLKTAYLDAGLLPPAELDDETDGGNPSAIDADPETGPETKAIEASPDQASEMDLVSDRERLCELELIAIDQLEVAWTL